MSQPQRIVIRRFSYEQRREIIRRSEAGEAGNAISRVFGVSTTSIHNILRKHKAGTLLLEPPPPKEPGPKQKPKKREKLKLDLAQRLEVVARVDAGETQIAVARDYGVTRAYISLIHIAHKNGTLIKDKPPRLGRVPHPVLTEEEKDQLFETIRLNYPVKFGLENFGPDPTADPWEWTPRRTAELCSRLFGKRPTMDNGMKSIISQARRTAPCNVECEPSPHLDESGFSPEMLADERFMTWVRSPIAQQIREREHAAWLREKTQYAERQSQRTGKKITVSSLKDSAKTGKKTAVAAAENVPVPASDNSFRKEVEAYEAGLAGGVGVRTGKHAKNRPHPAAAKKKRKKR